MRLDRWWLVRLLKWLFPKSIKEIIQDELTDALHPDFGYVWREDGQGGKLIKQARFQGWCECLDAVRTSLVDYPNAGGDIEIMKEVERIAKSYGK